MKNIWLDGMMGLVVGDALGVPVQFLYRENFCHLQVCQRERYYNLWK